MPVWRAETQCFIEDEEIFFPVVSVNHSDAPKNYNVKISATDAYGKSIVTKDAAITVPKGSKYHVNEIMLPELATRGYYKLNTVISLDGKQVSDYESFISVLPLHDQSVQDGALSKSYGQHYHHDYNPSFFRKQNASITRGFDVFKWREVDTNGAFTASYIFIGATNSPLELGELAIYDERGELVTATGAQALFDEQETVPEEGPTYLNGMYFDEIYHGRAAMETLRGIYPYETVHPPLGKTLIAVGVSTFGMTPFGWRFMGTLFGVGMLAALYVLLKNMFGKTFVAACGTLLFGFEFMRFVQTRIATVDTYPVFFIILSYLFMYRFLTTKADRPLRETIRSLGFSGLFFGIGVATKWIVVYAGVGLLVMYILKIITDYRYYYAPANSGGYTARVVKTLAFTSLTFIVVPAIIYVVSYIPFGLGKNMGSRMLFDPEYYKMVWGVQINTFKYHSALVAEHPYSSWWYQWIVNQRPILYYLDYLDGGARSAFAAFGNPVVWWGGLVAMLVMIFRSIFYRDARALVILIGYLAQLVPWMLISRIVFAYHYFPSTVFLVLGISHMFDTIYERAALPDNREYLKLKPPDGIIPGRRKLHGKKVIIAFTAAAGVLFVLFYPVLTGVPASAEYLKSVVKWMPSWPF